MTFGLVGTLILFAICYVVSESYLESEAIRRRMAREKAEQERRERMNVG